MNYDFIKYDIEDLKPEEVLQYLRKSQSDDPSLTVEEVLERHEGILNEWAERNLGSCVPEENTYREVVSGETIKERPEIKTIIKRMESPRIRAISIVEPQRLTRGDLEDIGSIMKLIKYSNTLVITPNKIYNLHDKYDWDALERELKQGNDYLEYTKTILARGRLRSVKEGNYIGSIPPYGYDKIWVKDGKKKCPTLKENKVEADVVRLIFDLYVNQDMGRQNICHKLIEMGAKPRKSEKNWNPSQIKTILENQHYLGKVIWNFRKIVKVVEDGEVIKKRPQAKIGEFLVYEGKHDAIIDEDLFKRAQEKCGRNTKEKASTSIRNPLAGIVYCSCGRAMYLRTYKRPKCTKLAEPRLICDGQTYCKTGSVVYEEMYEKVKDILRECIEDFEIRINNDQGDSAKLHANLIKQLEKKAKQLNEDEVKLWDERSRNRGTDDEMPDHIFKQLKDNIKKEQEEVQTALCKACDSMPESIDYEERLVRFKDALEALDNPKASAKAKNTLLKACIEKINYSRPQPVRLNRKNCLEYGIQPEDLKSGSNWYAPQYEIDIILKV